jgi:hypothetical protein
MRRTGTNAGGGRRNPRAFPRQTLRRRLARLGGMAGVSLLTAVMGIGMAATPANAAETEVEDVTFSWSVNDESTGGSYFGGCNFLVAGEAGDTGMARIWTANDAGTVYKTDEDGNFRVGNTTIRKSDGVAVNSFSKRCSTADGATVNSNTNAQADDNHTGDFVEITGGTGTIDPETDTADIRWEGSWTFAYYGGMTYWTISDPHLKVTNGKGAITGTYSGYGTDMDDLSKWIKLDPVEGPIANLQNSTVDVTETGFEVTPDYLGVETDTEGRNIQDRSQEWWGAFPQEWIDFNVATGQDSYWYSSAGGATSIQPRKPTNPITVEIASPMPPGQVPEAITGLEVGPGHNSASVSWEHPSNGAAPKYELAWAKGSQSVGQDTDPKNDSGWSSQNLGAVKSATINGLEPETEYTVALRASNKNEDGEYPEDLVGAWISTTFTTGKTPAEEPPPDDTPDSLPGGDEENGDETGDGSSSDGAVFRWGMNREAGSGAYFGGCNFITAGEAPDTGMSKVWTDKSFYKTKAGNVSVRKPNASGDWVDATWDNKCLDRNGKTLSTNGKDQWSEQQVVITGGERTTSGDGVKIQWKGSFSVVFYGGMTYWFAKDPVLELDGNGNGTVTAEASGYGAAMYDSSKWDKLSSTTITLANVKGVDVDKAESDGGFTVTPEYLGVKYSGTGGEEDSGGNDVGGAGGNPNKQAPRTAENEDYWGAFPSDFLDFQNETGQFSYWFSSDGARDPYKPTVPMTVGYSEDYDTTAGDYSGEEAAGGSGGAPQATNPDAGAQPDGANGGGAPEAASAEEADLSEDRSAFSQVAQDAAGMEGIPTRTVVIAAITGGAGLAATITSIVYFRRRLGLDPAAFV